MHSCTTLSLPSVTEATPSAAETTPSITEATPSVTEATPYENYPALLSNDPLLGQLIVSPTEVIFHQSHSQALARLVLKSWPETWE